MNLSVNQRLLAIILGAVLALFITGMISFFSSQKITAELKFTDENIIKSLAILSSAERDFLLIRVNALYHLSYSEPEKKKPHEETIRHNIQEIQKRLAEYEKDLVVDERDREMLRADRHLFAIYLQALEKVLAHSNANAREAAVTVVESEWKPAGERLTAAFLEHTRFKERFVDQVVQKSMDSGRRNSFLALIISLLGIAFVAGIGYLLHQGMNAPSDGRAD